MIMMKIRVLATAVLMAVAALTATVAAQDVDFYRKYADKGDTEAMYNLAICYFSGQGVTQNYDEATMWLTKAAKKNYAPAQSKLALCYITGTGVLKDYKKAWELVQKAMKKDNAEAYYIAANMYAEGMHVEKDPFKWLENTVRAAELGDADAFLDLGKAYFQGDPDVGIAEDNAEALKYFVEAAGKDNAEAQYYVGLCNSDGYGTAKDPETAFLYYERSAEQGFGPAQAALAEAYLYGKGVERDASKGIELLNLATAQNIPAAYRIAGDCYLRGIGVGHDSSKALEFYKTAVDGGDVFSLPMLGEIYLLGKGVAQDVAKGTQYLQSAVDAGVPLGYGYMGNLYMHGLGKTADTAKALEYYQKGAAAGDAYSKFQLYMMYRDGVGVTQDSTKAIQLLREAADDFSPEAMFSLAMEYIDGSILDEDADKALDLLTKAFNAGAENAAGFLGIIYYNDSPYRDFTKAVKYLLHADAHPEGYADDALKDIYAALADCYQNGFGVTADSDKASYYRSKAGTAVYQPETVMPEFSPSDTTLASALKEMNAVCPLNIGMDAYIDSFNYIPAENLVEIRYSIGGVLAKSLIDSQDAKAVKRHARLSLSDPNLAPFITILVNGGAGLRTFFRNPDNGKTFSIDIPLEDLREILNSPLSQEERARILAYSSIERANSTCPQDLGDGLSLVKVFSLGNNVINEFRMENNLMEAYAGNDDLFREIMMSAMLPMISTNQLMKNELAVYYNAGFNYVMRFTDGGANHIDVTLTNEKIGSLLAE